MYFTDSAGLCKKGIRFADVILEWGSLSQSPKPAELFLCGGISRSAERDEGRRPSTLRAF